MLVRYYITGAVKFPEGSAFAPEVENQIKLRTGDMVTINPVLEYPESSSILSPKALDIEILDHDCTTQDITKQAAENKVSLYDLSPGTEFVFAGQTIRNRITDVGSRTATYIRLDKDDPSWYHGPPYAIVEHVLDEYDIEGISVIHYPDQGIQIEAAPVDPYSAAAVARLVREKRASYLVHHDCGICDAPVGYAFNCGLVLFDSNCDCPAYSPPRPSSYQDISDFLKMQSSDEMRDKILERIK